MLSTCSTPLAFPIRLHRPKHFSLLYACYMLKHVLHAALLRQIVVFPSPTPKIKDNHLSGNRDCLFNMPFYRTVNQLTHQLTKKQRANHPTSNKASKLTTNQSTQPPTRKLIKDEYLREKCPFLCPVYPFLEHRTLMGIVLELKGCSPGWGPGYCHSKNFSCEWQFSCCGKAAYFLKHIRGLLEKYLTVFFYANTWWIII